MAAVLAALFLHDLVGMDHWEADLFQEGARMVRLHFANRAEQTDQALRQEGADGGGNEKRLDAHVDQPRDAADGIIGVEGAEDQVTCQRRADGDFGRLEIAHFPDHDHIGIAAQNAAQGGGEVEIDFRLDRDLHDAGELVLDRILDRDDAPFHGVEHGEKGVERGALAATGGPGEQDDSIGQREQVADFLLRFRHQAEVRKTEIAAGEETQANALAGNGRDRRHADVDRLAFQFKIDTAILRHAAFRDVEVRHDLDARKHAGLEHFDPRGHGHFMQHAIDAITDAQVVLQRLHVNIGRAFVERLAHDLVDEADDGCLGIVFVQHAHFLLHIEAGVVDIASFQNRVEGFRTHAVAGPKRGQDAAPGRHAPRDGLVDFVGDDLACGQVERIVGQHVQVGLVQLHGVKLVAQGEARREFGAELVVHQRQGGIPERQAETGTEFLEKLVLRNELLSQQATDDRRLLREIRFDRLVNRGFLSQTGFHGQIFEEGRGHGRTLTQARGGFTDNISPNGGVISAPCHAIVSQPSPFVT